VLLARHQFTLQDYGYWVRASALRGVCRTGVCVHVRPCVRWYSLRLYPRRDGQAEFTCVSGYVYRDGLLQMQTVAHPSILIGPGVD